MPASQRKTTLRERCRRYGVEHLSSSDLLVLLADDDAMRALESVDGSLRQLRKSGLPNVTKTKATMIYAALELGRRMVLEDAPEGTPFKNPRDVFAFFGPRMADLVAEEFHIGILDSQHRLQRDVMITKGILNSSLVHPREVFREAIKENAAAIILVHNHPSGDPTASPDDRAVTEQLVAAGRLLDIPVRDHVIIGRGRYVSFAEAGLL